MVMGLRPEGRGTGSVYFRFDVGNLVYNSINYALENAVIQSRWIELTMLLPGMYIWCLYEKVQLTQDLYRTDPNKTL